MRTGDACSDVRSLVHRAGLLLYCGVDTGTASGRCSALFMASHREAKNRYTAVLEKLKSASNVGFILVSCMGGCRGPGFFLDTHEWMEYLTNDHDA